MNHQTFEQQAIAIAESAHARIAALLGRAATNAPQVAPIEETEA